jgi:hypothetical protein
MPDDRGTGSMGMAQLPDRPAGGSGVMTLGAPFYGENAPPPSDTPGEEPIFETPEESAITKLLGQFVQEIQNADSERRRKESAWVKIETLDGGRGIEEIPEGYQESTFHYRRMPRIIQTAKAKLVKNVIPLHGRPWEVNPSPRTKMKLEPDVQAERLANLRTEISDIHEAMGMEELADDMCEFMCQLGTYVVYGPVQLSEPRLRWQDGQEVIDEEDVNKPMWKGYNPKDVYPDPNGKRPQDLEYVHFHHVFSPHQIRTLEDDKTFIADELGQLLSDLPDGNWSGEKLRWETLPSTPSRRYVTWMRIGFLTADALEALGEKVPSYKNTEDPAAKRAMEESLWEIWFCGSHILKVSKRKFQPKRMPVQFVPFRRDPTSIFGIGPAEAAMHIVELLTNTCRAIEDALADTSGYQVVIDAGSIANTDLRVRPRKTWIYKNKGVARKEGPSGKPVEFFAVPSNLPHLLECFKLYEAMIPVCSGVPEAVTGQDMGSGVRTDSMQESVFESLEEFLKDVVGNVDRYWWKPHLNDVYSWIQAYYSDRSNLMVDAVIEVQGVRGAIRREIVGRKVKDFYMTGRQFGSSDWTNDIEVERAVAEGMGLEANKAVLSVKDMLEKQRLRLEQKRADAAAGRSAEDAAAEKERAHISIRDATIEMYKVAMSADPNDPITIPAAENLFKMLGELDSKAAAALAVRARLIAQAMLQKGLATQQEAAILEKPPVADSPLQMPAASRDPGQAAQAQQMVGTVPHPPSDSPAPAVPTTQQVPAGGAQ